MGEAKSREWYDEISSVYCNDLPILHEVWVTVAARLKRMRAISVADLGCGGGHLLAMLEEQRRFRTIGVDWSLGMLRVAQHRCKSPLINAELPQVVSSLNVDCVTLTEVLEHLPDASDRNLFCALRPKTRYVASVPNFDSVSHVRVFDTVASIRERYEGCVTVEDVEAIALTSTRVIYVFEGQRL